METQKPQGGAQPISANAKPATTSCRKKKNTDDATFLQDVRDHIDEFIHASMDEHKECFKNTIQKMFRASQVVAVKNAETSGIESALPLQTTVSK